ncbi:PqqD family peptide modification chaperone, partial [Clostridioides difficile]|uniref:PqqD family peptide modification chaperone n=1 Tax=Clostridioides difficile TaxID=1496 RepID=UPI00155B367B
KIELDEYSSFVFLQIDGQRTVREIGKNLEAKYGEESHPLYESTAKFSTDFTKLQEILDEKSKLEKELEYKYERWEYLNNLA